MYEERKEEGAPEVVTGRVAELRKLEAAERALADALCAYARSAPGGGQMFRLAERHRELATLLGERVKVLGGVPEVEPDDQWLIGKPEELETILFAVEAALRTFHDHLIDLDHETMVMVRDRVLPTHEETLAALTGERNPDEIEREYG